MLTVSQQITLYGDFNCPFCFVLNEWLCQLELEGRVIWQPIEHEPKLDHKVSHTKFELEKLSSEFKEVLRRDTGVEIKLPESRPNSKLSLCLLEWSRKVFPEHFNALKNAIYRALWQKGLDISSQAVLETIVSKIDGLEVSSYKTILKEYRGVELGTKEWLGTEKDRIPLGIGPQGNFYQGLGTKVDFQEFLFAGIRDLEDPGSC
ncbi:MAG: hypothetical protein HN509_02280 [Halobacteriovoraceae bacterium]|jgi:predicted DsbA family dithiol-disulfide isomerase|nr:hypothetical protein [Halobacteriovoraceae bacterium]